MLPYDRNNIFAKILRHEIPCHKVFENDEVLAFHDIHPKSKVHVIVIPKGEYISFVDFISKAPPQTVVNFFNQVRHIAQLLKIEEPGYRLITNHGPASGQEVMHFHVHLLSPGANL